MILVSFALAGTLEGVVLGPDGHPEAGANVRIYDERFVQRGTVTDTDGHWSLLDVPEGRWRVRVLPDTLTQGSETWAGGAVGLCTGARHVVSADSVETVDVTLQPGTELLGRLTDLEGGAAAGVIVDALPVWSDETAVQTRSTLSATDGTFRITGLPAAPDGRDQVLLSFDGDAPKQFHPAVWSSLDALPVDVPPGAPVTLPETTLLPGTSVQGSVWTEEGPASSGYVGLYDGLQGHGAEVQPDGTFRFWNMRGVPLLLWSNLPDTARTYWPDLADPGSLLEVGDPGAEITDVRIDVLPAATVTGRFAADLPHEDFRVLPVRADGTAGQSVGVQEDGTFRLTTVGAGDWQLELVSESSTWLSGPLPGGDFLAEAGDLIELGDLEPSPAAVVEGTVTDPYTGRPVYGALVSAVDPVGGGRYGGRSGRDGTYRIGRIPPGIWSLEVDFGVSCEGDRDFVSLQWPGHYNPDLHGTVELTADAPFRWDVQMPEDADDDQMADGWELENGLDPTVDDRNEDPDGDGFDNLREFWLGTDPQQVYEGDGCDCATTPWPGPTFLGDLFRRRATIDMD